jgi:hypothetical protein
MKNPRVLVLGILAAVPLCQCAALDQAEQAACHAAYQLCYAKLGALCSENCTDAPGGGQPDPPSPWYGSDAINSPPPNACAEPLTGYGACVECVTTSCCTEAVACFSETTCTCLMAPTTPGITWPEDVPCGASDAIYTAASTCIADHCATACPSKGAP